MLYKTGRTPFPVIQKRMVKNHFRKGVVGFSKIVPLNMENELLQSLQ
jgi:hypothetical protein